MWSLFYGRFYIYNDLVNWVIPFVKSKLALGTSYGQNPLWAFYELSLGAWRELRDE